MWSTKSTESIGLFPGRKTFGPLFLMIVPPIFNLWMWFVLVERNGSLSEFYKDVESQGVVSAVLQGWRMPTTFEFQMIGAYVAFQMLLMKLPAAVVTGPTSVTGHVPKYLDNGFTAYVITMATAGVLHFTGVFPLQTIFDHFQGMLVAQSAVVMPLVCLFLFIKADVAPGPSDQYRSGNPIFDYYWGKELYPRLFGWDFKVLINCRFGMMGWPLLLLSYAAKQAELNGTVSDSLLVSIGIQLVYITKFFWWEAGYWRSVDIAVDAGGWYLLWGCGAFLPIMYTSPSLYLVKQPVTWGTGAALAIFVAGTACVIINYLSDKQRQDFRATNGKALVWGAEPVIIHAEYETEDGAVRKSILLASGYWGLARHFHYLPEILASFFWTMPGGFSGGLQYIYVIYLTILLTDRAYRDDAKCRSKYGKYWDKYCELVPKRIIPFLF